MKFKVFFILFFLQTSLLLPIVKKMDFFEMMKESDLSFYGEVENILSYWEDGNIWTDVNFKILEPLKGDLKNNYYKLKIMGGTVGEIYQWVEDIPSFSLYEKSIIFLKEGRILGGFQGKLYVKENYVYYDGIKYNINEFLDSLKKGFKEANHPVLSSIIEKKPKIHSYGRLDGKVKKEGYKIELAEPYATIFPVYFDNEIDYDGDGFKRHTKLCWDVDVSDRKSTLNVYSKVYWRVTGDQSWVLLGITDLQTIKGSDPDEFYVDIEGATHGFYDFRIEVYREGKESYDDFEDPSDNSELSAYQMELPEEDAEGSGAYIININPSKASAGTKSEVEIRGIGFEASKGNGKVEFFYQYGEPKISAYVNKWSEESIICEVPIGYVNQYPASAGSGPVQVTTNSGVLSNEYKFRVTFGYGRVKWEGQNPVVDYYIGENISNWQEAIKSAALTWSSEANFNLNYAGTTSNTKASKNGKNEVMYSKLDSNTIGQATYWSGGGKFYECDLVLNNSMKWSTDEKTPSGYYDVETITLHEFGHWLNLRDLYGNYGDGEYDQAKVMYGYGSTGKNKRDLHPDDADGIIWIYGSSRPPYADFSFEPKLVFSGEEISFYDLSKYNPVQWHWDFGDGETSEEKNPKHTFYFSGIRKVRLTVSNQYGSTTIEKYVIVNPKNSIPPLASQATYNLILPASAKAIGQYQTNWVTDLSIYNPNSENINVYAYFLKSGEDNSNSSGMEILIPSLRMHKIKDALLSLFSKENVFGAIYFKSSKRFFVVSRTYNDLGSEGTYGQFIPAIDLQNFLAGGEEGFLLNLIQTKRFRTNIGFINFSDKPVSFDLRFYKESGSLIGQLPVTLKPYSHAQYLSPISQFTSEEIENAYAIVSQLSENSKIAGYASVVDNKSSDPIFISLGKKSEIYGKKHQFIPIIARAKGGYKTNWRSDVKIFNPFQKQNILFKFYTQSGFYEKTQTIDQSSLISYNDIISSLFPSAQGDLAGSLHIYSDNGLFITSRTYNLVEEENKTYGQYIPGASEEESIKANETGIILHLSYTQDFRCNIGFTEMFGSDATVQIKLYNDKRSLLGYKNYQINAFSNLQITNIFGDLGITNYYEAAYAEVRLVSGAGFYSYASVIDNRIGDSIFIPFLK